MNQDEFIEFIRTLIDTDYGGQQQIFAQAMGIGTTYVSDVLSKRRNPGNKFLGAIGYEKRILYVKSAR